MCPRCGVMRRDIESHIRALHHYDDDDALMALVDTARRGMDRRPTTRRQRRDKTLSGQPRGEPKKCPYCPFLTRYIRSHLKKIHNVDHMPDKLDMRLSGSKKGTFWFP